MASASRSISAIDGSCCSRTATSEAVRRYSKELFPGVLGWSVLEVPPERGHIPRDARRQSLLLARRRESLGASLVRQRPAGACRRRALRGFRSAPFSRYGLALEG